MIIDCQTQIWDSLDMLGPEVAEQLRHLPVMPWERIDATTDAHFKAMQPVVVTLVHGFVSEHLGACVATKTIADYVKRDPDRLVGVAGIDPMRESFRDDVDEAIERGMRGVTISPAAQNYHPLHTAATKLYEKCEAHHLPVFVHPATRIARTTMMEFSPAHLFDEVARDFPKLKLIIGRVGHPWTAVTLEMLAKHPNVFADIGDLVRRPWELYQVILSAHQQGVIDHLLFASGFPFCTPETAITNLYSLNSLTQGTHLPTVPREQLRSVVERDTLTLLGIDGVEGASNTAAIPAAPDDDADDQASKDKSDADRKDDPAAAPPADPAETQVGENSA